MNKGKIKEEKGEKEEKEKEGGEGLTKYIFNYIRRRDFF